MYEPHTVAVRTLCEFTAKVGDLDLRFTPAPTGLQGMAGHAEVTSRRGGPYQREVTLSGQYLHLQVRGRADGYDPATQQLEEIKTHRGDVNRVPANHRALHWAQARVYGALLCNKLGLQSLTVALVYFDVASQKETVLTELHQAAELQLFFESLCERYLQWAEQEAAHRAARDLALQSLSFPHPEFRKGQRLLAESVYKACTAGRSLLAQAPTGIGKTIGTLFPVLKAMGGQGLDKIFFLTAKTPGRQLALDALHRLKTHAPLMPLRVLELVARDKACEHLDKACHGDSCPLAKGFYDRLPAARLAAAAHADLSKPALRTIALSHSVCPYYLAQAMVRHSDVVVGDYNHFFDLSAMLFALAQQDEWRVSVLVDEAHNLIPRARQMYTAELSSESALRLRAHAPVELKRPFTRALKPWRALAQSQTQAYLVYSELPEKLIYALQQLSGDITEFFADNPTHVDAALQGFYFELLFFMRLVELHGAHSLFDVTLQDSGSLLCLRNVVPAPMLKARWAAAQSATLFSATLKPTHYLQTLLGLPDDVLWVDVPSTFEPSQLQVQVARHISTRFADRQQSLHSVVALMARQYTRRPGNYLAFFSSFDYLQAVLQAFVLAHPHINTWQQTRRMDEAARDAFLNQFGADTEGIGFAVLGGAFGEGIDLPGTRLIGAFIATLGLPQVNPVNEQFRARLQATVGQGYDFTYTFPGLQKVVQAAGRVIRTPQDQGVVWLMDDRFAESDIAALLPDWWQIDHTLA
jgi:DNA excision repair protein ERCC-2